MTTPEERANADNDSTPQRPDNPSPEKQRPQTTDEILRTMEGVAEWPIAFDVVRLATHLNTPQPRIPEHWDEYLKMPAFLGHLRTMLLDAKKLDNELRQLKARIVLDAHCFMRINALCVNTPYDTIPETPQA